MMEGLHANGKCPTIFPAGTQEVPVKAKKDSLGCCPKPLEASPIRFG